MQRSFIITCVFRIDVFYINAIEPNSERNNVFPHYSPLLFFLFCIIKFGQVLWMKFMCTMQDKSQFEVCVMLQNCTMFCNLNILHCLLCCSMKTIVNDGHCKNLPSWWVHHALVFFTWIQLNVTMKESTFFSFSKKIRIYIFKYATTL